MDKRKYLCQVRFEGVGTPDNPAVFIELENMDGVSVGGDYAHWHLDGEYSLLQIKHPAPDLLARVEMLEEVDRRALTLLVDMSFYNGIPHMLNEEQRKEYQDTIKNLRQAINPPADEKEIGNGQEV